MKPIVAIPTKDRPDRLNKLLTKLEENFAQFHTDAHVAVFDDTKTNSAEEIVAKHSSNLDILHYGTEHKNYLATFGNPELFRQSYGGNRNAILATFPNHRIIMLDDDMAPFSVKAKGPKMKVTIPLEKSQVHLGNLRYPSEKDTFTSTDFVDILLKDLGRKPSKRNIFVDMDVPVSGSIRGTRMKRHSIPSHITKITQTGHTDTYEFVRAQVNPLLCNDRIKPSFTTQCSYACVAMNTAYTANIPFVPTRYKYEDILHSNMLFSAGLSSVRSTKANMLHTSGKGNITLEEAIQQDVIASVASSILQEECKYVYTHGGTYSDIVRSNFDSFSAEEIMARAIGKTLRFFQTTCNTNDTAYMREQIKNELYLAQRTFKAWPDVLKKVRE
ncbi:MAG: glycosyltransferase family 2 protein [Candidatus Woesearchaeota archaeon]